MSEREDNIRVFYSPQANESFNAGVHDYVNLLRHIFDPNDLLELEEMYLSLAFKTLRIIGLPLPQIIRITWDAAPDIHRPIDIHGNELNTHEVADGILALEERAKLEGRNLDFRDIYSKIVR